MQTPITEEFALNDRNVVGAKADVRRSGVRRLAIDVGLFKMGLDRCD